MPYKRYIQQRRCLGNEKSNRFPGIFAVVADKPKRQFVSKCKKASAHLVIRHHLFFCHGAADAVLKVAAGGSVANALVDDGKAEGVAVGGCQIARQRTDAFDGAGLGSHVAANRTGSHAAL